MKLTTDMTDSTAIPYFLWDEELTIAELRARLAEGSDWERDRLLGKMLREARDVDVWFFVSPATVAEALPRIERRLGKRRDFWHWLIHGWRADGLLPRE
jgi:hypothetical protein